MPNTAPDSGTGGKKDAISYAQSKLGYKEQGGWNMFTQSKEPWCHGFASWCAQQCGWIGRYAPSTKSCQVGRQWFRNKGRYKGRGEYTPQRNDFIYFVGSKNKPGETHHVGIVEYVANGYVHTIEGNSSDQVRRRSYSLSARNILGYGLVHDYVNNVAGTTYVNRDTPATAQGKKYNAAFTAYYPHNDSMEGGYLDSHGHRLNPANKTCASLPKWYGKKILIGGTGTKLDGQVYTITDTGGSFKDLKPDPDDDKKRKTIAPIDILMSTKAECNNFGRRSGWIILDYNGENYSSTPSTAQAGTTQAATAASPGNAAQNNSPISTQNTSDAQKQAQIEAELKYLKDFLTAYKKKQKAAKKADKKNTVEELEVVSTGNKTKVNADMLIHNASGYFHVPVLDGMTVTWERKGTPGKLVFQTISDKKYPITPGNEVRLTIDNKVFFYGFVFTVQKTAEGLANVTVYDQIRYLKAKDTYIWKGKTAGDIVKKIAKDFKMQTGTIAKTKYKISRVDDGETLIDIIQNALDETLYYSGEIYTLHDNGGKLCLKSPDQMKCDCLLDKDTGQDYTYSVSIDKDVYNQIKLAYKDEQTGKVDFYVAKDSAHINAWGLLQYYDTIASPKLGKPKSQVLLILYNQLSRILSLKDYFGDLNVRAGSMVPVKLDLGDVKVERYMLVDKVTHRFENGLHTMSLEVSGGGFDSSE